jgi:hypothetical protein
MPNELARPARGTITATANGPIVPAAIAQAGDKAAKRFIEFFAATTRNTNTRRAYGRAVYDFFLWTDDLGLALPDIVTSSRYTSPPISSS